MSDELLLLPQSTSPSGKQLATVDDAVEFDSTHTDLRAWSKYKLQKNLTVTTIFENIHFFPELLISGIVYQIRFWRLTLLMHLRIVLINTGLTKMLFMTTNQI